MSSTRVSRRKNFPANRRSSSTVRAPRPSPSPVPRRRIRPLAQPNSSRPSLTKSHLKRSKSEPSLWIPGGIEVEPSVEQQDEEGVLYRPRTCTDIFASSDNLFSEIPGNEQGYNKDAKVVVNVMVEGSPGPIRTMLKLGTNIEETIKVVVNKYNEEGRTPRLDNDAVSSCQLHYSSFSLDSLNKSDLIGDVGTRTFYLRKSDLGYINDSVSDMTPCSSHKDITRVASSNQLTASTQFFQIFIEQHIKKIIRKTRKIWRFFGCITCAV